MSRPKAVSRRHPVKSMFMGVIGWPRPDMGFDGKIFLRRVSRPKQITRATVHRRFVDETGLNNELKNGAWRSLYSQGMTVGELRETIVVTCDIDDFIAE